MASWELVPSLVRLRADLNGVAPGRDKTSDGTIGDSAHADRSSSHNPDETGTAPVRDADSKNEVHAFDADVDLREPGLTMEMIVQHLVSRHRSGDEKRLRNIIFNHRIWAASSGWKQQAYNGASPHTGHAHFEASYETKQEADASSWRLEDIPVALTAADKNWIVGQIDARADQMEANLLAKMPAAVGNLKVNVTPGSKVASMQPWSRVDGYGSEERHEIEAAIEAAKDEILKAVAK